MFKVEAIVREEKLEAVKSALQAIEVNGITISQVMGCGKQGGYTETVRGTEIEINLLPKIKFEVAVSSEEWKNKAIDAIAQAADTGNIGDGKIFSYKLEDAVRIRTKELGIAALN